jgi:hypothetical protein
MGASSSRGNPAASALPRVFPQHSSVNVSETLKVLTLQQFVAAAKAEAAQHGLHGSGFGSASGSGSLGVLPYHLTAPPGVIPKVVWRTGPFPITEVPADFANAMHTWSVHAPGWTQVYVTDDDADVFIGSPEVEAAVPGAAAAYRSLVPSAFRADLWRLVAVSMFGGIYADMSVWLVGAIENIVNPVVDEFVMPVDRPETPALWQGFFAAYKDHPLMTAMAAQVVANVQARKYGTFMYADLDITGPLAVARALRDFFHLPYTGAGFVPGRYTMAHPGTQTAFRVYFPKVDADLKGGQGAASVLRIRWPEYYATLYNPTRAPKYGHLFRARAVFGRDRTSDAALAAVRPQPKAAAVFVDPSGLHPAAARVLTNFHHHLPLQWDLYYFHGNTPGAASGAQAATAPLARAGRRVVVRPLQAASLTQAQHRDLMTSKAFWDAIDAEHILVLTPASAVCGGSGLDIQNFTQYPYLGCDVWDGRPSYAGTDDAGPAPLRFSQDAAGNLLATTHALPPTSMSLRSKAFVLDCLRTATPATIAGAPTEDSFFRACAEATLPASARPSATVAGQFCTQARATTPSWGAHSAASRLPPSQRMQFLQSCPEAGGL